MFLAGCANRKNCGSIFRSADGLKWELVFRDEGRDKTRVYTYYDFLQADGKIVAVGGGDGPYKSGCARVLSTTDGKTWDGSLYHFELSGPLLCAAYGKSRFVAHGGSGYVSHFTSSADAKTWTDPDKGRLPWYQGEQSMVKKLAFGNDHFVGIGAYRRVVTSADGLTWKDNPDKDRAPFISLAFGNGRFVAGGMHGLRMTSADGIHWDGKAGGELGEHINEVVWTGEEFVAIGIEVTYKSADGVRWTRHATKVRPARAGYGNGLFLCSNLRGTEAYRSTDAVDWERLAPIPEHSYYGGFGWYAD